MPAVLNKDFFTSCDVYTAHIGLYCSSTYEGEGKCFGETTGDLWFDVSIKAGPLGDLANSYEARIRFSGGGGNWAAALLYQNASPITITQQGINYGVVFNPLLDVLSRKVDWEYDFNNKSMRLEAEVASPPATSSTPTRFASTSNNFLQSTNQYPLRQTNSRIAGIRISVTSSKGTQSIPADSGASIYAQNYTLYSNVTIKFWKNNVALSTLNNITLRSENWNNTTLPTVETDFII